MNGFFYILENSPSLFHRIHNGGKIIVHQDHIGGIFCHVGSRSAHGTADIRFLKRRGVVDAVPHHSHLLALLHQLLHIPGLILGKHLGKDGGKPHLPGNGIGGLLVVPGDHGGADAHFLQGPDRGHAVLLHHISHSDDARKSPVHGDQHGGLALCRQVVSLLCPGEL